MGSKSKDRKLDTTHYTNPSPESGRDTDMLTEQELKDMGFSLARKRHNNAASHMPKCDHCGKRVKEPVTSYVKNGYDVVEEGELLHVNCAVARHEAIIAYLTQLTSS